ncbi:hypothetical protein FDJ70_06455 [Clostridium botulinum]|uniref:Uncharacterized protein n=1 Tax=Clostridium botulinum D str. 1873 TaxID=592027 RepID=A0A9P2G6U1_CLOBO|nr:MULTISPECIES: hypothetical protein [Clostridium]AYF53418.1 hypothetical protein DFH04_01010 [Clostridium novyi]EES91053.1 conserved hypothetical protein [Clostridium botulinum D str. 1873]MBO3442498.1 hypothetical protein [Clostridium haemolyticum]NFV47313.1 hypothetical protein [Clostridium botulinum]QPW55872.1 hypothetical protein IRP61_02325 [Clostridium botulinum]
MIKKRKILNVLSKGAIAAIISASFSISAYASADGFLAKSLLDGKLYYYNYNDLMKAYENNAVGLESKLFNDYISKEVIAIHDDKNGFVDYKVIEEAAENAVVSEQEFDLDNFIKDASDKVEISSEVISIHENEEGEIFTNNYEVKDNVVKNHKDVQPKPLKEDKEENHSKGKKKEPIVNPVVKNEEELPNKVETVERDNEVKKDKPIAEKQTEKNVEIQSNLVQHYVRRERAQAQIGDLAFKFKGKGQNKLQNPQTIKILDKTIQLDAGDDSSKIKTKILKAFEGNKDWIFGVGYVVIEENGARVQYKCKKIMENVDKLAEDTSEIKFIQVDEDMGTLGVAEKKEVCEVTVNSASNKQETINFTLKDTRANITLAKVTINVNPQDDTRKIAELLYNELKSKASRLYDIKLEKEKSKIILKQRLAINARTTVSIER